MVRVINLCMCRCGKVGNCCMKLVIVIGFSLYLLVLLDVLICMNMFSVCCFSVRCWFSVWVMCRLFSVWNLLVKCVMLCVLLVCRWLIID